MISASEIRILMHRQRVELAVRAALEASAAMNGPAVDLGGMVLRIADRMTDSRAKARLLGSVARLLAEAGRPGDGVALLVAALHASRLAGRDTVLEVLADGAPAIASIDNGELLRRLCQELDTMDTWFGL